MTAAGIGAACLLFAACSSNTPSASSTTTSTMAGRSTTTTFKSHASTTVPPTTTTIPFNFKYNARSDVATTGCIPVLGSWKLTGTIKSSFHNTRNYQIVVDYVTQPGDTVLDTKVVHVPNVAAGASANWSAVGAPGQKSPGCVIRDVDATPIGVNP
jgi:hypothetical protein